MQQFVINKILDSKNKIKVEKLIKEKALEDGVNPNDLKLSSTMNNLLLKMQEDELIYINWNYKSQKNEKKICYVSLSMDAEDIDDYLSHNKIRLGDKQKEIVQFLKHNEEIEINDLIKLFDYITSNNIKYEKLNIISKGD